MEVDGEEKAEKKEDEEVEDEEEDEDEDTKGEARHPFSILSWPFISNASELKVQRFVALLSYWTRSH
jgi:hypothetical protein